MACRNNFQLNCKYELFLFIIVNMIFLTMLISLALVAVSARWICRPEPKAAKRPAPPKL